MCVSTANKYEWWGKKSPTKRTKVKLFKTARGFKSERVPRVSQNWGGGGGGEEEEEEKSCMFVPRLIMLCNAVHFLIAL
jgi:hypothetical protein